MADKADPHVSATNEKEKGRAWSGLVRVKSKWAGGRDLADRWAEQRKKSAQELETIFFLFSFVHFYLIQISIIQIKFKFQTEIQIQNKSQHEMLMYLLITLLIY